MHSLQTRSGAGSAAVRLAGAVAVALPLVGFVSLLLREQLDPQLHNHQAHFVIFGLAGGLAFTLGYAAGEAANRRGDARILLLSLAFMATGGFMGLHAFGTAGVLFSESRAGFQVAIPFGLLVSGFFAFASAFVDARPDLGHELAAAWMREAGLEIEVDGAGNLIGRVPGGERLVWTGSHLDTVPGAGRFDGTLGVVAGLEAVERLGLPGLGVVVFRDEERGCAGSRGCSIRPDAYVELHIEQGPTLLNANVPLGVVTAIVGYVRGRKTFDGTAGHAGTTPMDMRQDALVAAAEYVLSAREIARGIDGAVATVGQAAVEPGGTNVIPGRVVLSVDARAPDGERLDRLAAALEIEEPARTEPSPMAEPVRAALQDAVTAVGVPVLELPSGAGHDAGILATAGVPAGMLFVRSLNGGISHNPAELSSPEDIALAVDALEHALRRLVA